MRAVARQTATFAPRQTRPGALQLAFRGREPTIVCIVVQHLHGPAGDIKPGGVERRRSPNSCLSSPREFSSPVAADRRMIAMRWRISRRRRPQSYSCRRHARICWREHRLCPGRSDFGEPGQTSTIPLPSVAHLAWGTAPSVSTRSTHPQCAQLAIPLSHHSSAESDFATRSRTSARIAHRHAFLLLHEHESTPAEQCSWILRNSRKPVVFSPSYSWRLGSQAVARADGSNIVSPAGDHKITLSRRVIVC